jgi:hypothetical protein
VFAWQIFQSIDTLVEVGEILYWVGQCHAMNLYEYGRVPAWLTQFLTSSLRGQLHNQTALTPEKATEL